MFYKKIIFSFFISIFSFNPLFSMESGNDSLPNSAEKEETEDLLDLFSIWQDVFSHIQDGFDSDQKDINKSIFKAAIEGNLVQIKLLMEQEPTFFKQALDRTITSLNLSPLALAASSNMECLQYLLEIYKIARSDNFQTQLNLALGIAAYFGNVDTIKLLANEGAAFDSQLSKHLASPIHLAASNQNGVGFLFLLTNYQSQLKLDAKDKKGNTALHYAIFNNAFNVVSLLIDFDNSLLEMANKEGQTPLFWSTYYQKAEIVELLVERGADIYAMDKAKDTILTAALESSEYKNEEKALAIFEIIKKHLISTRGDWKGLINKACASDQWAPLHLAARNNMPKILRRLLEDGAAFDAQNESMNSPLHVAVQYGSLDVVYVFNDWFEGSKDQKQLWEQPGEDGNTLFHTANESESVDTLKFLFKKIPHLINKENRQGDTPLFKALSYLNPEIVSCLVAAGASTTKFDKDGDTLLTALLSYEYTADDFISLIRQMGTKNRDLINRENRKTKSTPLFKAVSYNIDIKVIQILLELGADPNAKNSKNFSILDNAVEENYFDAVKLLVEKGAQVGNLQKGALIKAIKLYQQDESYKDIKELLFECYKKHKRNKKKLVPITTNVSLSPEIENWVKAEMSKKSPKKSRKSKENKKPVKHSKQPKGNKSLKNKSSDQQNKILKNSNNFEEKLGTIKKQQNDDLRHNDNDLNHSSVAKYKTVTKKEKRHHPLSILNKKRNLDTKNVFVSMSDNTIEIIDRSEATLENDNDYSGFTIFLPVQRINQHDTRELLNTFKRYFSPNYNKYNLIYDYLHSFPQNIDPLIIQYGQLIEGHPSECDMYKQRMGYIGVSSNCNKFYKLFLRARLDKIHHIHQKAAAAQGHEGQATGLGYLELFFFVNEERKTINIVNRLFKPLNNPFYN